MAPQVGLESGRTRIRTQTYPRKSACGHLSNLVRLATDVHSFTRSEGAESSPVIGPMCPRCLSENLQSDWMQYISGCNP
jgi:hypothetical protein